jgi:hypothetical protein
MNPVELRLSSAQLRAEGLAQTLILDTQQKKYIIYGANMEIKSSVANGNFIIGSIREDGSLSFAERPIVHSTASAAKKEVERLLSINTDKRYAYLELKGVAYAKGVCWNER